MFWESILIALEGLKANKLRSFLTMLGIIIGVGAVIVEATGVTPEGRISVNCLSLHDDAQIPSFARLAEVIHAGGARAPVDGREAAVRAGGGDRVSRERAGRG